MPAVCCHRLVGVLAVCALAGCRPSETGIADGEAPMKALAVGAPSTRYTHDFWLREARAGTALWDSAHAFCSAVWTSGDTDARPNCGHVRTADFATSAGRRGIRGRNMDVDANRLPP